MITGLLIASLMVSGNDNLKKRHEERWSFIFKTKKTTELIVLKQNGHNQILRSIKKP